MEEACKSVGLLLIFHFLIVDEDDSADLNDNDVPDRDKIKKQSQLLVDSKTKRRTTKKKKKTK